MDKRLTASVIVPAFNAEATIAACLQAICAQRVAAEEIDYEILLVNDASSDTTVTIARSFAAVRIVDMPRNQGRSAARNAGAAAASGDILVFTDADCEPTPLWLAQMVRPFSADASVVGVKGAYYSRQPEVVARFTQLELEEKYREMARHETISFIDTYSAAYRRDIFLINGGFDQSLTYSLLEDQDFSFRLAAQGHKMVFAPAARVYHRHLTSPWRYYKRKWQIGKWKNVILRRYPERRANDSRTPLSLKLQFGLALLLTLLMPFAFVAAIFRPIRHLVNHPIRCLLTVILLPFTATTLPFIAAVLRADPKIAPFTWPMLLVRALGLAHGYLDGLLRLHRIK